jgi:hypothetical protein
LGERRVRNAKVEGSIPFSSTIFLGFARSRQRCAPRASLLQGTVDESGAAIE